MKTNGKNKQTKTNKTKNKKFTSTRSIHWYRHSRRLTFLFLLSIGRQSICVVYAVVDFESSFRRKKGIMQFRRKKGTTASTNTSRSLGVRDPNVQRGECAHAASLSTQSAREVTTGASRVRARCGLILAIMPRGGGHERAVLAAWLPACAPSRYSRLAQRQTAS